METAAEYMNAGLWQDGADTLGEAVAAAPDKNKINPLVYYYLGYFAENLHQSGKATEYYALAEKMPSEYVFPFQFETIEVLHHAMQANPKDAHAPYYLGNLLFDGQPAEAAKLWTAAVAIDPSLAIAHRNLAIAYAYDKSAPSAAKAVAQLEQAVATGHASARQFAELDEMYEAAGAPLAKRLSVMEKNQQIVEKNDGSLAREAGLLVSAGKLDQAIHLLTGREFAVWEGGNLNVAENWTDAHILRGRKQLDGKHATESLAEFKAALEIPANLPSEGIEVEARAPEVNYWIGAAYAALGDNDRANQHWRKSADQKIETPAPHRRHRGGMSSVDLQVYYQALSLRRLDQTAKAEELLRQLVETANAALRDGPAAPNPASSPDTQRAQRVALATAHYAAALGYSGLNEAQKAREELNKALAASPDHVGARAMLAGLD
jgi:tetratricopeptide (TPR) repeat protein